MRSLFTVHQGWCRLLRSLNTDLPLNTRSLRLNTDHAVFDFMCICLRRSGKGKLLLRSYSGQLLTAPDRRKKLKQYVLTVWLICVIKKVSLTWSIMLESFRLCMPVMRVADSSLSLVFCSERYVFISCTRSRSSVAVSRASFNSSMVDDWSFCTLLTYEDGHISKTYRLQRYIMSQKQ